MVCKYCGKPMEGTVCTHCGKETVLAKYSTGLETLMSGTISPEDARLPGISDETSTFVVSEGTKKDHEMIFRNGFEEGYKKAAKKMRSEEIRILKLAAAASAAIFLIITVAACLIAGRISYRNGYRNGKSEGEFIQQQYAIEVQKAYQSGFEEGLRQAGVIVPDAEAQLSI